MIEAVHLDADVPAKPASPEPRVRRGKLAGVVRRYEPAVATLVVIVVVTRLAGGAFLDIGGSGDIPAAPQIAPFTSAAGPPAVSVPPALDGELVTAPPQRPQVDGGRTTPSSVAPAPARPAEVAEEEHLSVFAAIPEPGVPVALAVAMDGVVWVGTDNGVGGKEGSPVLHRFSPDGQLLGTHVVPGVSEGITAVHTSATGVVHLLSRAPAALHRFDPATGDAAVLAVIPDVASCLASFGASACDGSLMNARPLPSALAFDEDGNAYVADAGQAAIWRISPSSDGAVQWLVDPTWSSPTTPSGPTGLVVDGAGNLVVVVRSTLTEDDGVVLLQEVTASGEPGARTELARTGSGTRPAAVTLSESGRAYITLQATGQVLVLDATGAEVARLPTRGDRIDAPRGIAFAGTAVLVASQTPGAPLRGAVYRLPVDELGAPSYDGPSR